MPLSSDTSAALSLLERIQRSMKETDETKLSDQCSNDLNTLISVLESPVFRGIINIQESLKELKKQVSQHPSIVPTDFDISREGKLILHVSPEGGHQLEFAVHGEPSTITLQPAPALITQVDHEDAAPSKATESIELQELCHLQKQQQQQDEEELVEAKAKPEEVKKDEGVRLVDEDEMPPAITNATLDQELQRAIHTAAQGRDVHHIQLYKPEGSSLGFSVVGLRSEKRGELGIYVQGIQPTGIAAQ
nr:uncharacterized protein LOC128703705 [Cherax quadricarinatus]